MEQNDGSTVPKNPDKRDKHYSGKKKGTTVKNNVITDRGKGGKICYLSDTVEGKCHDKKLADDEDYASPEGSKLWQDTGYQGYAPEHVTILQLKKKPRGSESTPVGKVGLILYREEYKLLRQLVEVLLWELKP